MKNLYPILVALFCTITTTLVAQVPNLSSYPSAKATIYLDFDGHTVNGTSWNTSGPIYAGPSNLNAAQIEEVFNRVAEDYRAFDVNITTDSTLYWKAPVNQRMRVILTITWEWYGRAGGVAYTNSFTWGDNTPCFIFTSLHNYNTKNIAEAASHEAGHTLGLRHQARYDATCNKTEEYNSGVGSGEIGWAPIMGVGYYRNLTTWHNGPNPYGCSNAQDDLLIITTNNGFGYRVDVNDGSFRKAPANTFQSNRFSQKGIILNSADVDMYQFNMATANKLKMNVAPYSVGTGDNGSNLDIQVSLYNSKQKLIATYNQPESLSASIDTTLSAGTYYYSVSGAGNAYTSNYASMGEYTVEAALPSSNFTILPLHQLDLKAVADGNQHKLTWNIEADETLVKQVLEVSANGRDFEVLAQPATDVRSFSYVPLNGALQYRLSVTFDNGRQYYSNIIAMRTNNSNKKPQLFTNVIRANSLMVSSPAPYAYSITDFSGKLISKGQLGQGSSTITTGTLTSGMYLIRFSNGAEQYIEKFARQ